MAIKQLMEEKGIPGTLRVYGAAAEESEGAKVFMARAGLFDDLDAMLHWHPMDSARVGKVRMAAAQHMDIEFKGKKAHAGMYPWRGRSALDAAEIFLHSVNMMREHDENWSMRLGDFRITAVSIKDQEGPVTELVGKVRDQAELSGILETLYEAHFTLLSVEMLGVENK